MGSRISLRDLDRPRGRPGSNQVIKKHPRVTEKAEPQQFLSVQYTVGMASLATFAAVQPTTVKGLAAGSSIAGTKLHVKQSRVSCRPAKSRAGAVEAKYGEKSVYFDLDDIANTTGQWDVYGSDAASPYNSLQSKFFLTFAAPFSKRGLLLKFLLLGGGSLLAYVSSQATGDVLPIVKGPQLPPKPGPRGKI